MTVPYCKLWKNSNTKSDKHDTDLNDLTMIWMTARYQNDQLLKDYLQWIQSYNIVYNKVNIIWQRFI